MKVILCILLLMVSVAGVSGTAAPSYPINSTVLTTNDRLISLFPVPLSSPSLIGHDDIANYSAYGYGYWNYTQGLSYERRLNLTSPGYVNRSVTNNARLLNFFAMTDVHITDEESPASAIFFGIFSNESSAYSPVMLLTPQVLDSAIQTINIQHQQKPFDFGISLGDSANSAQYNELRWYIDIIDGQLVNPDSGVKDDPVPGPHNDYQDEFQAAGLNPSIKWYQVLGNHDHFFTGFLPPNAYLQQTLIGTDIINLGSVFTDPAGLNSRGSYMGSINGSTPNGTVIGVGVNSSFSSTPKIRAADSNRYNLTEAKWMSEFFNTTSSPNGHGFNQADAATGFACYTFEPRSDIPIRVIVLDDTQSNTDPVDTDSLGYGHGSLDKKRYDWLVNELENGQRDKKLMIIAAHIPIGVLAAGQMAGWSSKAYVTESQLISKLKSYPNLVLWISGHLHINQVTAFASDDSSRPEYGFWEVQTSSLRDYPQNYRTFDIERNTDNSVSVFITDMDPSVSDGSLAAKSRSYGIAAQEIDLNPLNPSPNGTYNAELVKQLSPEMQEIIGNLFKNPVVPDNGGDDSYSPIINPVGKTITETVNVGGGSAVTRAEMTGINLGKNLVITAMPRSGLPATMVAPPTTIYQYISITSSTITGVVDHTVFDFSISQSWLTENGFTVGDMVMMHNVDGQWQTLDTRFVSQSNGNVFYQSTTPGFSYFAIAYQKGGTIMELGTPIPTATTTTLALAKTSVTGTLRLPVAITTKETQNPAPAPTTAPVEGTPLATIVIGFVGVITIIVAAFLVRRWWIRKQNPALFRNYD